LKRRRKNNEAVLKPEFQNGQDRSIQSCFFIAMKINMQGFVLTVPGFDTAVFCRNIAKNNAES
jgi:hypothetical protein